MLSAMDSIYCLNTESERKHTVAYCALFLLQSNNSIEETWGWWSHWGTFGAKEESESGKCI